MSQIEGRPIAIGPGDAKSSRYKIVGALVKRKSDDGYRIMPVDAELEISHERLRQLVQKADDNKARKSHDGPLTVRVTRGKLVT
jgi:hypothetical protein